MRTQKTILLSTHIIGISWIIIEKIWGKEQNTPLYRCLFNASGGLHRWVTYSRCFMVDNYGTHNQGRKLLESPPYNYWDSDSDRPVLILTNTPPWLIIY